MAIQWQNPEDIQVATQGRKTPEDVVKMVEDKGLDRYSIQLTPSVIQTTKWEDWIDYWSVDFDYESKPEIIKFKTLDGKIEEEWTGNYIFENEWQSFREKKGDEKLQLKSSEKEILSGKTKVAVKVVDIFGNDTMKVLKVKI